MWKKTGKYLREISVVIVGIVITFTGSDLIAKISKQKEVRTVMELVKEELIDNRNGIMIIERSIKEDSILFGYLESNLDNIKILSVDTLKANKHLLSRINIFIHTDDAYELLRSSSLMQHVKNKELMLKIMKAYDLITFKEIQIKNYGDLKNEMVVDIFRNIPRKDYDRINGNNIYETYEYALSQDKFWNFIKFPSTFLENAQFYSFVDEINEIISFIDKEYKFY